MSKATSSRLSGLSFVDPHRGASLARTFVDVPAGGREELPGSPGPLEVRVAGAGRLWDLAGWNAATYATSLLVVHRGAIVHEWYADGAGPRSLFLGASMTKSALAHLVGTAVAAGAMSLEDRVVDHVPELAGSGYAGCTVAHVATMTTGLDYLEDHRDPTSAASRLTAAFAGSGQVSSRELLVGLRAKHEPGTRYEYCTADSQVLDWVRERATATSYAQALGTLWRTLGCTSEAVVGVDSAGVAMAGGALAATARDWARIGLLQHDGRWADDPVLDPTWIEATCVPGREFLRPGRLPSSITTHAGFGMHWWPLDDAGRRVTADGSRGQFCYVDRDRDVVVVKTSQWPYDDAWADRQYRDLSYLGLPAVAEAAART